MSVIDYICKYPFSQNAKNTTNVKTLKNAIFEASNNGSYNYIIILPTDNLCEQGRYEFITTLDKSKCSKNNKNSGNLYKLPPPNVINNSKNVCLTLKNNTLDYMINITYKNINNDNNNINKYKASKLYINNTNKYSNLNQATKDITVQNQLNNNSICNPITTELNTCRKNLQKTMNDNIEILEKLKKYENTINNIVNKIDTQNTHKLNKFDTNIIDTTKKINLHNYLYTKSTTINTIIKSSILFIFLCVMLIIIYKYIYKSNILQK